MFVGVGDVLPGESKFVLSCFNHYFYFECKNHRTVSSDNQKRHQKVQALKWFAAFKRAVAKLQRFAPMDSAIISFEWTICK
jgi:hypothetical protein